jgi:hypothetical protein
LFVNAIQLVSYTPQRLSNGDRVSFGPPNQSEFNYQFIEKYSPNLNNNNISYGLSGINLTSIPVIPIVTRIQSDSTEQLLPSNTVRFNIEPNVSGTISVLIAIKYYFLICIYFIVFINQIISCQQICRQEVELIIK